MYRIIAITTCVCLGLFGCGSLGPKTASLNHSSYKELINSDFRRRLWIPLADARTGSINVFSVDEAEAPRKYLNIYCNRDGGQLAHVELDKDVLSGHQKIKELSGVFACKSDSGKVLWLAEVDAERHIGGLEGRGTFGYLFIVRDKSL